MRDAACRGMSPKLFFLERGQSSQPGLRVCAMCTVKGQCGDYADSSKSEVGIWAGVVRSREPINGVEPVVSVTSVSRPTYEEINDQEVNQLIPTSFSASSMQTFLDCPARYNAEAIAKAQTPGGSAASLGTTCHTAIEEWVKFEHHKQTYDDGWPVMKAFYDQAYWENFKDSRRYQEGALLLQKWLERQDWSRRTVLSVEVKNSFMLPLSIGDIPFNYIMDRFDMRDDGVPEVVDYKTLSIPVQPEDLKQKIQARAYALAAQLAYPDADRIWVTFDMLRFDPIGIVFTKEENRATWRFLRKTAERIIASDGHLETLNPTCRWCIRKTICNTLNTHATHGGTMGLTDPVLAAKRAFDLRNKIGGIQAEIADLEKVTLDWMRNEDTDFLTTDDFDISVAVTGRRHIDAAMVAAIVGPQIMTKYGDIKVTSVDQILKNENLTSDQKSRLKQLFTTTYSEPAIKIKSKLVV